MDKCKDYDSDCHDIENKQHCYEYRPDRGYCPYLGKHMIKKLKTIKQILSEYKNKGYKIDQYDESCQIDLDGGYKEESYIIAKSMFKYFGTEIGVFDSGEQSIKYEYYIIERSKYLNNFWFKKDWFEQDDNLLEDKLFEI